MNTQSGLEVTVKGDLPPEVMARIGSAVQQTVRDEVASLDLLRDYTEDTPTPTAPNRDISDVVIPGFPGGGIIMGIIFKPPVAEEF